MTDSRARPKSRPSRLAPQHRQELAQSGISLQTAAKAGLYSESREDRIEALLGWRIGRNRSLGDCLILPYRHHDGSLNGYCRLKPDNPRNDAEGNRVKYEAPRGKPPRAYFPPETIGALSDCSVPLLITEGEKKALAADQAGFPCVGISGVYSWCKKRRRDENNKPDGPKELIDDLAAIPLDRRRVYIAFDSDLAFKPNVQTAEFELAEALQKRGAVVRCIRIPSGAENEKCGLDDFLVVQSAAGLESLIRESVEPENPKNATVLTCLADVTPQEIEWLWPARIPLGKLALVIGDPETGKSLATLDMAARVSAGRAWPDGPDCQPGAVILLTVEDDLDDTIRPRLDAAGAEVRRIVHLDLNCLKADMDKLERTLRRVPNVRLIVIDPISAYLPGIDSHKNAEVRTVLKPLAALAARFGIAVVGVTHLNKQDGGAAMYRAMGSLAFVAAARTAWVVAKDQEDPQLRLFLRVKNNLSAERKGLKFRIVGPPGLPRIEWEAGEVETTADEALAWNRDGHNGGKQNAAVAWLASVLAGKWVQVSHLQEWANKQGYAWRTVERAARELKVQRVRPGFGKPCKWFLPKRTG